MSRKILHYFMTFLWGMALPALVYASEEEIKSTDTKKEHQVLQLPYAFYNESMGASVGYVYGAVGYPQKQSSMVATIMAGSTGSGMGFFMANDLRLPWNKRLFFDPIMSIGYFQDAEAYLDSNPSYAYQRSGSNDSDENDFVAGDGWDNFFRVKIKYLIPIGNGKNEITTQYVLEDGILVSGATGGQSLNPLKSGRTFFELRPFYRSQQLEGKDVDNTIKTNGLDFALFWDNRDYYLNPTYGNSLRLKLSRDFGWSDSSNSWTSVDGELDAYFPLGKSTLFRKQVIALNFWSSYSPSWEEGPGNTVSNRPPAYTGATLGGLWRMKGYPSQRFSDKAAIYYSAEFRMTPTWNPFDNWSWLQKHVGVKWLQLVPFAELGRVAPSWEVGELHSDMKWSAGVGVRVMAKDIVARIDTAASEEGFKVQMMVNHPFQF